MAFRATSSILEQNAKRVPDHYLFNGMGCDGDNVSPPVEWRDAPPDTKSFALTVFDPDAPKVGGWWHWAVVNIPANVTEIEEGASTQDLMPPEADELINDFGDTHYGGPCPPKGDHPHHYIFTVYALKKENIHVTPNSTPASIKKTLEHESLATSSFVVEYGH